VVESLGPAPVLEVLAHAGVTPLPPYITTPLDDPERYQTTYSCALGSAAAPTAGLHFTPALDAALAAAGVDVESVTLHVGLGTFKPLQEGPLEAVTLHSESFALEAAVWSRLSAARREGRRVVAVGTTSMRVLEHVALTGASADDAALIRGDTRLFIRPGFPFRLVDGLITNFHLPRTSLFALVMAFCGVDETRAIYRHAVALRYRFYSFGDAMLAL
jgi:S-adenosylmethionine:tRNA ribosyltransferase-isomerase